MSTRFSQSFLVGILMLFTLSPVAFADALEDMARGEEAMKGEDLLEATKFYRRSAEQNYAPAQVALGELMHSTLENDEAAGWFFMAAYQGDAAGAYNLGQMYVVGEGVEKNSGKALYWLKHAAEKNYLPAVEVMADAYRKGDLGLAAIDLDQAKIWESKLPALRAAAKKIIDGKIAASLAVQKAMYEAAVKKAAEKKVTEKKTNDEAAAKKVDAEDEATAKKQLKKN